MKIHQKKIKNLILELSISDNPSPQLDKSQAITQVHVRPNHLFGDGVNPGTIQIAIDWDPTALHLRYQSTRERVSFRLFFFAKIDC